MRAQAFHRRPFQHRAVGWYQIMDTAIQYAIISSESLHSRPHAKPSCRNHGRISHSNIRFQVGWCPKRWLYIRCHWWKPPKNRVNLRVLMKGTIGDTLVSCKDETWQSVVEFRSWLAAVVVALPQIRHSTDRHSHSESHVITYQTPSQTIHITTGRWLPSCSVVQHTAIAYGILTTARAPSRTINTMDLFRDWS